jgi:tetratricopeptide (TPR) repeat protein
MQKNETQKLLHRARLQLEEGQYEAALDALQGVESEDQKHQKEAAYLLGWCYIQHKRWSEAVKILEPLVQQEEQQETEALAEQERQETETLAERERQALSLLHLGIAAVNLSHYHDASRHFTLCLKVLHDRRVHLPSVRIRARYSLAMTCLMRGLFDAAIKHYEEALRVARHYNREDELPDIYHGLSDAYCSVGDYVSAYLAAQEALQIYRLREDRPLEARMENKLGHIRLLLGDYRDASDHFTESLAIASSCNRPVIVMSNCADLADLRLAEGRLSEAKRYCQIALKTMEGVENPHMRGKVYAVIGKVVHAEANTVEGPKRRQLLEEAVQWFERAKEQLAQTQAYADMAQVYGTWAQVLEELGRTQEAIECWRAGYEVLSLHDETA